MLRTAGIELLGELGVPSEYEASFDLRAAKWCETVAWVGFTGPDVAGTLVISAGDPFLARSLPIPDADAAVKLDWIGELANMTLGFFKSLLLQRGVRIDLGLPMSAGRDELRFAPTSPLPIGVALRAGADAVLLGLDWAVAPGVEITDVRLGAEWPRDGHDGFFFA